MQEISKRPASRRAAVHEPTLPAGLLGHAASHESPPAGLAPEIEALWWDGHGDIEHALELLEDKRGMNAVWVRAYLRRKFGDEAMASFWYAKASRPIARGCATSERDTILKVLLEDRK